MIPKPIFNKKLLIIFAIAPILPDFDVVSFLVGIPYEHVLGHRGISHSIFFSLIMAGVLFALFLKRQCPGAKNKILIFTLLWAVISSHGILDALTSGGHGIALFSPIDNSRYFFPVTPIHVSPIGVKAFFSEWGVRVIVSEMKWVWIPLFGFWFMVSFLKLILIKINQYIDWINNGRLKTSLSRKYGRKFFR